HCVSHRSCSAHASPATAASAADFYSPSLHDALPIYFCERPIANAFGIEVSITHTLGLGRSACTHSRSTIPCRPTCPSRGCACWRSEEHTSELQSHLNLVCRLLLQHKIPSRWLRRRLL